MLRHTYTRLLVSDFPTSFRFYRDILWASRPPLGTRTMCTRISRQEAQPWPSFVGIAWLQRSARQTSLRRPTVRTRSPSSSRSRIEVENVDAAYAQLQAKGVRFVTAPQDHAEWGIRTAHFRDPDGNLLEIYSPLPVRGS